MGRNMYLIDSYQSTYKIISLKEKLLFFLGYGDIVPVTTEGKVFTLAYAILGIPVFMWYIVKLGGLFRLLTMYIFSNMTSCFWYIIHTYKKIYTF